MPGSQLTDEEKERLLQLLREKDAAGLLDRPEVGREMSWTEREGAMYKGFIDWVAGLAPKGIEAVEKFTGKPISPYQVEPPTPLQEKRAAMQPAVGLGAEALRTAVRYPLGIAGFVPGLIQQMTTPGEHTPAETEWPRWEITKKHAASLRQMFADFLPVADWAMQKAAGVEDPSTTVDPSSPLSRLISGISGKPFDREAYREAVSRFVEAPETVLYTGQISKAALKPVKSLALKPEGIVPEQIKRVPLQDREIATMPSLAIHRGPKDIGITAPIRTPTNLFGAIPGQKARYGEAAAEASRSLVLVERDIRIEMGKRGETLDRSLHVAAKDKANWGKNGEKFYDHIVDPSKDHLLSKESLSAAKTVRQAMERDRAEIISRRRDELRHSVTKIVNKEWRAKHGLARKKLKPEQRVELDAAIENGLKQRVPDNWGIENYLPQMHPGAWDVWATGEGTRLWVGAARTPSEALAKAAEHYANHPKLTPEAYDVTGRAFKGWDVLRVSRPRLFRVANEIAKNADAAVSREQVVRFLRGTIGAKEARRKWAGFLQKRKGFEGYRKDIRGVLAVYNQNFVRWKYLTDLNKKIQPLIRQIKAEGRPNTAIEIESIFQHLWGRTPSLVSRLLDASLQKAPGLRDYVRPMAYERFLGRIKGGVVTMFLKVNPRFHTLNRLQRYQTTLPILRGGPHLSEWREGTRFYSSPEGRTAMDKFGIRHITGGKYLEGGRIYTKPLVRERLRSFAPETSNQEIAWATMYRRAKKLGMDDAAANDYAFLKGNVYTQFVHLSTDTPRILRGPTMSTILQFKRFSIKNVELGLDLIAERNYPGVAKWLGAQVLLGGVKMATSPLRLVGGAGAAWVTSETYNKIKKEHGKWIADVIAWGLPALVGLDMSYSFQLIDMPWGQNVPEKIGNFFMGPSGNVLYSVGQAMMATKGTEVSPLKRGLYAAARRVPGLKWIDALRAFGNRLDSGEYNFRDDAGRVRFRGDLKDIIVKGLGGRTVKEAEIDLLTSALLEINDQRDRVLDDFTNRAIKALESDSQFDTQMILDWNEAWPEFPITNQAMKSRFRSRLRGKDMDRFERTLKTMPRVFRPVGGLRGE